MFVNTGNSYKFQAGSRALALDWCRHIKQASEIHLPKVHVSFSQIASSNLLNGFCCCCIHLMASFPGQPGSDGTKKVNYSGF